MRTLFACTLLIGALGCGTARSWTQLGASKVAAPSSAALVVHLAFDECNPEGTATPDAAAPERLVGLHGHRLVEGVAGKALEFDGYPEQALDLGDLELSAPASVAFWVRTRDLFNDRRVLSQTSGATTTLAGSLRLMGQFEAWDGEAWQGLVTSDLRHNAWTHLAVVFDSNGDATAYLNGEERETVRCDLDFSGPRAAVGGKLTGQYGAVFNGILDEFRIYRGALTAAEVRALHRRHSPE